MVLNRDIDSYCLTLCGLLVRLWYRAMDDPPVAIQEGVLGSAATHCDTNIVAVRIGETKVGKSPWPQLNGLDHGLRSAGVSGTPMKVCDLQHDLDAKTKPVPRPRTQIVLCAEAGREAKTETDIAIDEGGIGMRHGGGFGSVNREPKMITVEAKRPIEIGHEQLQAKTCDMKTRRPNRHEYRQESARSR